MKSVDSTTTCADIDQAVKSSLSFLCHVESYLPRFLKSRLSMPINR